MTGDALDGMGALDSELSWLSSELEETRIAIDGIDTDGIDITWLDGTLDELVDLFDKLAD